MTDEVDVESLAQSAPRTPELRAEPAGSGAGAGQPAGAANRPVRRPSCSEAHQGRTADAPLCFTCGTKMRPAGSCYVCEGCGSTSGCS